MTDRLTKQDVIEAFCKLSEKVMREKFDYVEPADCFCGGGMAMVFNDYRYSDLVLKFISDAVSEKLEKETNHAD